MIMIPILDMDMDMDMLMADALRREPSDELGIRLKLTKVDYGNKKTGAELLPSNLWLRPYYSLALQDE
ncbi:MAG: hypothetical protein HETSPECPRED_002323, partial [Heterodermia speciosa]